MRDLAKISLVLVILFVTLNALDRPVWYFVLNDQFAALPLEQRTPDITGLDGTNAACLSLAETMRAKGAPDAHCVEVNLLEHWGVEAAKKVEATLNIAPIYYMLPEQPRRPAAPPPNSAARRC